MNRMMRHIVDVAFRLRAWDGVKEAAKAAGKPVPPPRTVVELLRGMVGKTGTLTGSLFDGIDDEQEHAITRAGVTLDWFAKAGCPIVSVDEETARAFASSPPPHEEDPAEWPLGVAYGLSIGQGPQVLPEFSPTGDGKGFVLAPPRGESVLRGVVDAAAHVGIPWS
jgi:hypothetical protein